MVGRAAVEPQLQLVRLAVDAEVHHEHQATGVGLVRGEPHGAADFVADGDVDKRRWPPSAGDEVRWVAGSW